MSLIGILDYKLNNVASVAAAVKRTGREPTLICSAEQIAACDALVLPGVGSFAQGMKALTPLAPAIRAFAQSGKPLLGICLGMQMLFQTGTEGGETAGLGILKGRVEKLTNAPKLPHMGWNTLDRTKPDCPLWNGLGERAWAYFVHSYAARPTNAAIIAATTTHGEPIVAAVQQDNVFGVQFHPEKSAADGQQILDNFLSRT